MSDSDTHAEPEPLEPIDPDLPTESVETTALTPIWTQEAAPPPPPPPPPWFGWAPAEPPPAPPVRRRRERSAAVAALVTVVALVIGFAVGRTTADTDSSRDTVASAPLTTPQTGDGSSGTNDTGNGNGNSNGAANGNGSSVADAVTPAIVNITTTVDGGKAAGTGMLISTDGKALTNNHVIAGATSISVEMQDGSTHSAEVLGYDLTDDVALIDIDGVANLPTIRTADSSTVSMGDPVVAIGNALGKGGSPTVVSGNVTGLDQTITASDDSGARSETLHGLIRSNAPIQPGDSGGALANSDGKVVGMNAAALTSNGFGLRDPSRTASEGYAIPIEDALDIAKQIERGDEDATVHVGPRGVMGVELSTQRDGFGDAAGGAAVSGVRAGSPAADAGIEAGDTLVSVNGKSVGSAAEVGTAMGQQHPGDKMKVTWVDSSGDRHSKTLTLIEGPPD